MPLSAVWCMPVYGSRPVPGTDVQRPLLRPGARSSASRSNWKIGSLDLSINRIVLLEFLVCGLLCALMAAAFRRPKVVPRTAQSILEILFAFVNKDIVEDIMGTKGRKYAPYLVSLFFFTWFCNLTEIVPGIEFPVDARTGLPLALALITLVLFVREGFKASGVGGYFKDVALPTRACPMADLHHPDADRAALDVPHPPVHPVRAALSQHDGRALPPRHHVCRHRLPSLRL